MRHLALHRAQACVKQDVGTRIDQQTEARLQSGLERMKQMGMVSKSVTAYRRPSHPAVLLCLFEKQ